MTSLRTAGAIHGWRRSRLRTPTVGTSGWATTTSTASRTRYVIYIQGKRGPGGMAPPPQPPMKKLGESDCVLPPPPTSNIKVVGQLKGIYPEFQVIRGFSQKIPAGLLSYDQIHS